MTQKVLHTPEIANSESDQVDTFTKKVSLYATDIDNLEKKRITGETIGSKVAVNTTRPELAMIMVEDGSVIYLGEAEPGSDTEAPVWRIQRIDTTSGVEVLWADGDDKFDNVFEDYATLSYN